VHTTTREIAVHCHLATEIFQWPTANSRESKDGSGDRGREGAVEVHDVRAGQRYKD